MGERRRFASDFVSNTLIALGANLPEPQGNPAANLERALSELASARLMIRSVSRFSRPLFPCRGWSRLRQRRSGSGIRYACGGHPSRFAQDRAPDGPQTRNPLGMRTLDLDLIGIENQVLPDRETFAAWSELDLDTQKLRAPDQLILPHPRVAERAFVLVPLADIVPDWRHPVSGKTVLQMCDALPEAVKAEVRPI